MKPVALTIAGSDSGGGAGIQGDLKTFAALGVYGASAITALTAQNTVAVAGVHAAPAAFVALQINTVLDDLPVAAVKTGMLYAADIVEAVAGALKGRGLPLVVDPVMIAKSGDALLRDEAVAALKTSLLPLALVVTPNIPEAEALAGMTVATRADMEEAARRIIRLGPAAVVIKGGHMEGDELTDLLYDGAAFHAFASRRVPTPHTHGTGCAFSAAITAGLAKGMTLRGAVAAAKEYIAGAVVAAEPLGHGHGPVNHFYGRGED